MLRLVVMLGVIVAGCAACAPASRSAADSLLADSMSARDHDASLHEAHTSGGATAAGGDTTFAAMQARGAMGMGVDQYTSTHTFEPRPDGGRITLRRDVKDSAGVAQIRAHLQVIADAFGAGDFTTPAFVHADPVPGTEIMAARRAMIAYTAAPLPGGAELIIHTTDSLALDAVHRFLAYQRREHRAGDGRAPLDALIKPGSGAPGAPAALATDDAARARE